MRERGDTVSEERPHSGGSRSPMSLFTAPSLPSELLLPPDPPRPLVLRGMAWATCLPSMPSLRDSVKSLGSGTTGVVSEQQVEWQPLIFVSLKSTQRLDKHLQPTDPQLLLPVSSCPPFPSHPPTAPVSSLRDHLLPKQNWCPSIPALSHPHLINWKNSNMF